MDDLMQQSQECPELFSYFSQYGEQEPASIDEVVNNIKGRITEIDKYFLIMKEVSKQRNLKKAC